MKRDTFINLAIPLLSSFLMLSLMDFLGHQPAEEMTFTGNSAKDMYSELPDIARETETELIKITRVEAEYQPIKITYKRMELTSLGRYYLTAYCPSECGYNGDNYPTGWLTASGNICHRADYEHRLSEPTTAAIDMSYNRFGDTFYIPYFDRTFIAEDNGAFRGKWIDLFYEDYASVLSFPSGYYEVFSVRWIEETVLVSEEDLQELMKVGATEYFRDKEKLRYDT